MRVDERANAYFQAMGHFEAGVNDLLKQFKDS